MLFDNSVVLYGFPARIRSDQGQKLESNLIKELCKISDVTSPIQPPTTQRETATVKDLIRRFSRCWVHRYTTRGVIGKLMFQHWLSATFHHSNRYSPYFLMFMRCLRLAIDAFLGLSTDALSATKQTEYVEKVSILRTSKFKKSRGEMLLSTKLVLISTSESLCRNVVSGEN